MANPTSNFNWQMPTPTDLVTDLPADFEVFGQAVDSSMADLLGGTTGQVLAKNSNTNMDFVWVTSDDANAIQNSIVDAKGDLIAATANDTPARLAIGTVNGMGLQVDSTAATGMKWDYDKVVQIVFANTNTSVSSSSNVLADSGLTATITPKSANNKVLVFYTQNGIYKNADTAVQIQLQRGGTAIQGNQSVWAGWTSSASTNTVGSVTGIYLDSPATTSATTYKTQFASTLNLATASVQFGSVYSSIVLMEVTP